MYNMPNITPRPPDPFTAVPYLTNNDIIPELSGRNLQSRAKS